MKVDDAYGIIKKPLARLPLAVEAFARRMPALYRRFDLHNPNPGYADTFHQDEKIDDTTLWLDTGAYSRSFKYAFPDRSTASRDDRNAEEDALNEAIRALPPGWEILIHLDVYESDQYLERPWPSMASWLVDEERKLIAKHNKHYLSDTYLSLTYNPTKSTTRKSRNAMYEERLIIGQGDEGDLTDFNAGVDSILAAFRRFATVAPLGVRPDPRDPNNPERKVDDQLSLHHRIISGEWVLIPAVSDDRRVADLIVPNGIDNYGQYVRVGRTLFRPFTLVNYPNRAVPDILDVVDAIPGEMIASWRFVTESDAVANRTLKKAYGGASLRETNLKAEVMGEMDSMVDKSKTAQKRDAEHARSLQNDGVSRHGYSTITITPIARLSGLTMEHITEAATTLNSTYDALAAQLKSRHFVIEDDLGQEEEALRGIAPGQTADNLVRPMLGTRPFASFIPTTSIWTGSPETTNPFYKGCTALSQFFTSGHKPFYFDPAIGNLSANLMILGDPGSRKSTLFGELLVDNLSRDQQLPTGSRTIVLDVGNSHRHLAWTSGQHVVLDPSMNPGLSLFWRLDEPEGLLHTLEIMRFLLAAIKQPFGAHDDALITALKAFSRTPRAARTMTMFLTQPGLSDALKNLLMKNYSREGPAGDLFEGTEPLKMRAHFQHIELGRLSVGSSLWAAAFYTLLREIDDTAKAEQPVVVGSEELWRLAEDEAMGKSLVDFIRLDRKNGLSLWSVTHYITDLIKTQAGRDLLAMSPTRIVLPSTSLKDEEVVAELVKRQFRHSDIRELAKHIGENYMLVTQNGRHRMAQWPVGKVGLNTFAVTGDEDRAASERMHALFEQQGALDDWYPEWIGSRIGGTDGERWRAHAYYYYETLSKDTTQRVEPPEHETLHGRDPFSENGGLDYAS